ncbi:hypothetical protein BVC80_1591g84 [Macleaya cordata]|uniref:Uncharacterized protein n=1 Tax=Macleaya cordata TaxID=56857 RepID=A0A200QIB9_MACCD|nr:hypothetical protein BVC80_1591g84 [Macleaya cordata]
MSSRLLSHDTCTSRQLSAHYLEMFLKSVFQNFSRSVLDLHQPLQSIDRPTNNDIAEVASNLSPGFGYVDLLDICQRTCRDILGGGYILMAFLAVSARFSGVSAMQLDFQYIVWAIHCFLSESISMTFTNLFYATCMPLWLGVVNSLNLNLCMWRFWSRGQELNLLFEDYVFWDGTVGLNAE